MRLLPLLVLLAAACARSNERVVADLEERARACPDKAADALLDEDRRSVPLETPVRAFELELLDERLPAVLGRINGMTMKLILDTGASLVSLSGPAAERAGLYLPPRPETAGSRSSSSASSNSRGGVSSRTERRSSSSSASAAVSGCARARFSNSVTTRSLERAHAAASRTSSGRSLT